MRVTSVSFVDWLNHRMGRLTPLAVLPPAMAYWRPDVSQEEAPPAFEPEKGLHFDMYA